MIFRKYYELRRVSDPEIKGVKTGLGQVELEEENPMTQKLLDFFSLDYWEKGKTVPDFEVTGCTASLCKGAKLTDFLDFAPNLITCPFMMSEKLAEVFSKFKIQQYYTHPVTLYKNGKQLPDRYYLFCCPYLGWDVINFPESVFYTQKSFFDNERTYIHYENAEDFNKNYQVGIRFEKIVFTSNFDKSLDFFAARIGDTYISEGLKDAIEILGFTGRRIFDTEQLIIV